jgi:hypothetical protein
MRDELAGVQGPGRLEGGGAAGAAFRGGAEEALLAAVMTGYVLATIAARYVYQRVFGRWL